MEGRAGVCRRSLLSRFVCHDRANNDVAFHSKHGQSGTKAADSAMQDVVARHPFPPQVSPKVTYQTRTNGSIAVHFDSPGALQLSDTHKHTKGVVCCKSKGAHPPQYFNVSTLAHASQARQGARQGARYGVRYGVCLSMYLHGLDRTRAVVLGQHRADDDDLLLLTLVGMQTARRWL